MIYELKKKKKIVTLIVYDEIFIKVYFSNVTLFKRYLNLCTLLMCTTK